MASKGGKITKGMSGIKRFMSERDAFRILSGQVGQTKFNANETDARNRANEVFGGRSRAGTRLERRNVGDPVRGGTERIGARVLSRNGNTRRVVMGNDTVSARTRRAQERSRNPETRTRLQPGSRVSRQRVVQEGNISNGANIRQLRLAPAVSSGRRSPSPAPARTPNASNSRVSPNRVRGARTVRGINPRTGVPMRVVMAPRRPRQR